MKIPCLSPAKYSEYGFIPISKALAPDLWKSLESKVAFLIVKTIKQQIPNINANSRQYLMTVFKFINFNLYLFIILLFISLFLKEHLPMDFVN